MHKPKVTVAAGIIWESNKFLAAFRPYHKPRGGYWEFPGGKQEIGEDISDTLKRELYEELGIKVQQFKHYMDHEYSYPDLHVNLVFIHVTKFLGTPHPNEGQTIKWLTPPEAIDYKFLPADIFILKHLHQEYSSGFLQILHNSK